MALAALFSMASCAAVNRRVLYGIVVTESSGNPLAIHDDTDGRSYFPSAKPQAAAIIVRLDRERHALSVGLTQVENSNWARYGVNGPQLLDARTNVAVGCAIYRENLFALRAYNTGTVLATRAGDHYADTVFAAGRMIISPRPHSPHSADRRRQPTPKRALRRRGAVDAAFGFSQRADPKMPVFP